jgi:hypothetical protein
MTIHDAEHIAWRMIVDAQAGAKAGDIGEFFAHLDDQIENAGGARGLVIGLLVAAGQTIQALSEQTGEAPLAVAERLRDAHSVELMDIDLDDEGDQS